MLTYDWCNFEFQSTVKCKNKSIPQLKALTNLKLLKPFREIHLVQL